MQATRGLGSTCRETCWTSARPRAPLATSSSTTWATACHFDRACLTAQSGPPLSVAHASVVPHKTGRGSGAPSLTAPCPSPPARSISAVQWLCYGHTKAQVPRCAPCLLSLPTLAILVATSPLLPSPPRPRERLIRFFQTLYVALRRGARAVLQLYPESSEQMELITNSAMRCGFSGGLVVDYPHRCGGRGRGAAAAGVRPPPSWCLALTLCNHAPAVPRLRSAI